MLGKDTKETASQGGVLKTVITLIDKLVRFVDKRCTAIITIVLILVIITGTTFLLEIEEIKESQRKWEDFSLVEKKGDGQMTLLSPSGRTFSGGTTGTMFKLKTKKQLEGFPSLYCILVGHGCSSCLNVSMIDINADLRHKNAYFSPVTIRRENVAYFARYKEGHMLATSHSIFGENNKILDDNKDPYLEKRIFDIYIKIDVPPGGNIFVNNFIVEGH